MAERQAWIRVLPPSPQLFKQPTQSFVSPISPIGPISPIDA